MSELFRVSAKAVIIQNGRVLLILKPNGRWDLPGGRLEFGESPQETVAREAQEELGLPVAVERLLHCGVRDKNKGPDVVVVSYLCRLQGHVAEIDLSHEHEQARLFAQPDIGSITLDPVYRQAVDHGFATLQAAE